MSTLVENVQKVKNAHAALKTAIASKGVDVPAGTKLTDMPALVEQIPSAPAYTSATKFYEGSGKVSIDVPATVFVDFTQATNLSSCFMDCTALTSLVLPAGFGQNAEDVSLCFIRCSSLTSLTLPAGFGQAATNIAGCFNTCNKLTTLNFPAVFGKVATNASRCFQGCSALITLILPDGFGQAATTLYSCFYNSRALTTLHLPAGFGQNATNLANCFGNCASLTTLHLPAGFGQNATNLANCFRNCAALTNITGNPNFKTSLQLGLPNLTHDSLMVVINGLQTVTETQTLTLGSENLAKLTDAEKQIATDKGWTLA